MQCEHARELASRALDQALSEPERKALAAHVATCPECTAATKDIAVMRHEISALGREVAPVHLKTRILDALADTDRQQPARLPAAWWQRGSVSLPRAAAAVIIASLLSAGLTYWIAGMDEARTRLDHDILTAHVRSLLDNPVQVASSDMHTVKPWFAGRVDVSPVVRDLSAEGFVLAGGRLDYVDGRRVAVVVYKQSKHVINVFTWAASAPQSVQRATRNGYNVVTWAANGIAYSAVSDLNIAEIERLRSLL